MSDPLPPPSHRAQIYETFEDPSYSTTAKWYSLGMMILIVLATLCFVLESEAMATTGILYDTNALVRATVALAACRPPLPDRSVTAPWLCVRHRRGYSA